MPDQGAVFILMVLPHSEGTSDPPPKFKVPSCPLSLEMILND
jgi:hypothetical protein